MKYSIIVITTTSLLFFFIGCSKTAQREEEVRRERPVKQDDIRERDSYKQSMPIEEDETDPNIDILDVVPNYSSDNKLLLLCYQGSCMITHAGNHTK